MADRGGRAGALAAGAALLSAAFAAPVCAAGPPAPKLGEPAPALSLVDVDGARLTLASLRGKVVVVDFWATWCAPCRTQTPKYVALHAKLRGQGLEILGISLDESAKPVREFRSRFGTSYRLALADEKVLKAWGGILGLPVAFVVDRAGRLRARHEGEDDVAAVEADVVRLLKEE